jgi:16S rRNA (uracil1498-N3)-methyltransferase
LHAPPVPTQLTLYCGLLKGDKQDFVTQKATELGVHRLVPVACQRSVPQLHEDRAERRQQRWTKIAQAAAQQSRRADIPEVTGPLSFAAALADSAQVSSVLRLLLFEGSAPPLHTVIHQQPQALAQLHLLIGPEGGFAPAELAAATEAGFVPVSLGPRILRAETAVVASLAVVQYALAAGA